ncbi:MAG: hypothetical protein AAGC55_09475 [Myxococcota bacterium]
MDSFEECAASDESFVRSAYVAVLSRRPRSQVTDNFEPEFDRHFPLPGLFEDALYGNSAGIEVERVYAPLRYNGFVARLETDDIGETRP